MHSQETNFQVTLQQQQNHGSSVKKTYSCAFEELALHQKPKSFEDWIQKPLLTSSNSYALTCKLKKLISK